LPRKLNRVRCVKDGNAGTLACQAFEEGSKPAITSDFLENRNLLMPLGERRVQARSPLIPVFARDAAV